MSLVGVRNRRFWHRQGLKAWWPFKPNTMKDKTTENDKKPIKDIDDYVRSLQPEVRRKEVKLLIDTAPDFLTWQILQIGRTQKKLDLKITSLREKKIFSKVENLNNHLDKQSFMEKILAACPGITLDAIMDECRKSMGGSLRDALKEVKNLCDSKVPQTLWRLEAERICKYFEGNGKFFWDTSSDRLRDMLFYKSKIYEINNNRPFNALMSSLCAFNYTTPEAKFIYEEMGNYCHNHGTRVQAFSWLHTDKVTNTVYLNMRSEGAKILKISAGEIVEIENGTNKDGILLAESPKMIPFKFKPDVDVKRAMILLRTIVMDNLACSFNDKYFVMSWFFTIFFVDFVETRLIMKFGGNTSSGKTAAARLLYFLCYGSEFIGDSTAASEFRSSDVTPLRVKDDVEGENLTTSMERILRIAATGGGREKSKSGTDHETSSEVMKSNFLITAIEDFNNMTLQNRTSPIRFHPKYHKNSFIESDLKTEIIKNRDEILSAFFICMAKQILPAMPERKEIIKNIREEYPNHAKKRMDEFLTICALICRVLCEHYRPFGSMNDSKGQAYSMLESWIKSQDVAAKEVARESNSVAYYLDQLIRPYELKWRKEHGGGLLDADCILEIDDYDLVMTVTNKEGDGELFENKVYIQFNATTQHIFALLNKLAKNTGQKFPFTTARQFGVHRKNEEKVLQDIGWTVTNGKMSSGICVYEWKRLIDKEPVA